MCFRIHPASLSIATCLVTVTSLLAADPPQLRKRSDPPVLRSSWDDLLAGVQSLEEWQERKLTLQRRFLELIRDDQKPAKPPLELKTLESVEVDGIYTRRLISYNVEADERAHAYLGIPRKLNGRAPAVVALVGTRPESKKWAAGLVEKQSMDYAYLDHLARRGYVVIAPDHFVAGDRIPPEGAYDTARFYQKHPAWTAVGKFTYEHSIAVDVLQSLSEVDPARIGTLGHSLGGHGALFLAAYDQRVKAAACNCGLAHFRHNSTPDAWARDRWYVYFKHIRPGLLEGRLPPIDFHEIIALVAPRAFLDLTAMNDTGMSGATPQRQKQVVLMNLKIMDVYELEKVPQNFAFYVHGRGHSVAYESRQLMYGWMDTHLKKRPE